MIFICSFLVLAIVFVTFILLLTAGIATFSSDKVKKSMSPPVSSSPVKKARVVITSKPKAYIDLNGRLIELLTKAEEAKAKKDGFKVVYK